VLFAGPGETIEITHRAASRDAFARGALLAARFAAGRRKGLYSMGDVIAASGRKTGGR
jgi:4-hydroxy-tetrahydrodipicolinate reductase